jgi:hypothetical protein
MLTHADIWNAVDRLAARAGLSASGLAKKAGLDPTTFNKSKRDHAGRPPALALDRVGREVAAGDRRHRRHVRVADHRPRRRLDAAMPLIGLARPARRLFRRRRLPTARAGTRSRFRR